MTRLEPGLEFLPQLTLVKVLGTGGMGEAWLAHDARREEDVVAKILPADASEERVALLRREARLVRKLRHAGIVPVYGFGQGEHGSAVLLRHMKGGDAGRLRGASPARIVRLGRELAEALAYLHEVGVVHRDVKITNVLLDEEGRAHVADFGIAAVDDPDDGGVTLHGGGSRATMSPQQRSGAPATPSDDVYSLGVLLYELLGGRPPFGADATDEEIRTVAPPPFETSHDAPDRLRSLVASLLAKDPRERPGDMTAVGVALQEVEDELSGAGTAPRLQAPPRAVSAPPPDVRLQAPPRVPDVVAPIPDRPRVPEIRRGPTPSPRRSRAQTLLLGTLGLAAVFVVLVLPRMTQPPDPVPEAAEGELERPAEAPPVVEYRDPVVPETPPPPAEAPPPQVEATPRPAPPAPPPPSRAEPVPTPDPAVARAKERAEELGAALSAAHEALERRDWTGARQALQRGAAIDPTSAALLDARRRVEEGERGEALARQQALARELEEKEDWTRAVAEYDVALRLDASVAFAVQGRPRAARRADLAAKLDYHIAHPLRLATDTVAEEAEVLLQRAREVDDPGPRHRQQIASLTRALEDVRSSISVVLESDGETEVVVHKVGRLGAFDRKTLELRPGIYTVIGKRSGYRDVRRRLVVEPKGPPPSLVVRCEEEI